jgi:hypothetical protein
MREIRLSGSEGGGTQVLPTPINGRLSGEPVEPHTSNLTLPYGLPGLAMQGSAFVCPTKSQR